MQYYYFVSGLPGISLEDSKLAYSPVEFREDAARHMTPQDYRLLELLHLPQELEHLLALVYNKDRANLEPSIYPNGWWETLLDLHRQKAQNPMLKIPSEYSHLPAFIGETLDEILIMEELPDFYTADTLLLGRAYDYFGTLKNDFLNAWYALDRDIRNILIAINGRAHDYSFSDFLIGDSEMVQALARSSSQDFGLGKSSELFESIYRLYEQNNILYRERAYDIYRWKWIDNTNFFNYFNVDRLLGYYSKLRILHRWTSMDTDSGKESFYDALHSLESGFDIPSEYSVHTRKRSSEAASDAV